MKLKTNKIFIKRSWKKIRNQKYKNHKKKYDKLGLKDEIENKGPITKK
jgi:superfamily II helicase